ncbi:MAG: STT3 domain-containing protein [Candidatus Omnitrophota bacterium]|jgi:dolichyl-diphosphooligosaccharide--protein glycosyltransferase
MNIPRKTGKYLFLLVPPLLVLAANIYFRSFPIYFPQLKTRAMEILSKSIEQRITQDVYAKFAQFNPIAKDKLVKNRVAEYKKADAKAINEQVNEGYKHLKERFQDKDGQTYLMELDCWHWAKYVENVVRLGHPGDRVENGKQIDAYMLAPLGSPLHWEHSLYYFSAFLYKVFSIFKRAPLFTFLFYLPLLFSATFIVLLYIFVYRHGGHLAAITSCMMMGLSPIFLHRSCAGWFDKDVLSLIFPLLVIWSYVNSSAAQNIRKKVFWVCVSSFWVGLFCYSWTHWWFVFAIVIIYEALYIIVLAAARFYLKKDNSANFREHAISVIIFFVSGLFWALVICGPEPITELYKALIFAVTLNKPLMASIWPNVYSTVGELRSMGIKEIANSVGSMPVFMISSFSMLALSVLSVVKRDYPRVKREIISILVIWTAVMLFASSRGIRFAMFLPFGLGISLGLLISEVYGYFRRKKNAAVIVLVLMAFLFVNVSLFRKAYTAANNTYPLIDDTWYKVLELIKEKTPEGTIINSWWDFGDWFKVIARRPAIFDGQSQDTPQAYWMAKAILSEDEDKAVGILRMLNNGGNSAFDTINGYIKDPLQSVLLLEGVIGSSPQKAQATLNNFLPASLTQKVMQLLYGTPGRACFIVDNTMIPKMGAISYLGTWDFSKVYIAQNFNKLEKEQIMEHLKGLGRNIEEAQRYYQEIFLIKPGNLDDWLSGRVLFYGEPVSGREKDAEVFFANGFIYTPKENAIRSNVGQVPRSLFVLQGNNFVEFTYPNANAPFSALVVKTDNGYKCVLFDRALANSMFVRLYFFKGIGLKHFSPLIDAEEGNSYIRVFNINW